MASDHKVLLQKQILFSIFKLNSGHFYCFRVMALPVGGQIYFMEIHQGRGEVPKGIFDSSWNKIVNTGYQCAESSYIIQAKLGNKNIDLLSCKAAELTEEDLLAKNKNYIPPGNYNISEWVKLVNSGFRLGQHFFLNDMRNQQEANDAQIALSLSAGEQEETVSADQEFAEQLDKEMNATPQRRSTPRKKATPQKKLL